MRINLHYEEGTYKQGSKIVLELKGLVSGVGA